MLCVQVDSAVLSSSAPAGEGLPVNWWGYILWDVFQEKHDGNMTSCSAGDFRFDSI